VLAIIATLALTAPHAEAKPVSGATLTASYAAAEDFWQARGVDPCDGTLRQARLPGGILGEAYVGPFPNGSLYCSVTLNTRVDWRYQAAGLWATPRETVCAVVVHERGHNTGRRHAGAGIMAPYLTFVPAACRRAL
jgi:hypothetical protein